MNFPLSISDSKSVTGWTDRQPRNSLSDVQIKYTRQVRPPIHAFYIMPLDSASAGPVVAEEQIRASGGHPVRLDSNQACWESPPT